MDLSLELPAPPLPLLITGITGVSGYNAFSYFRDRFPGQVFAIRQTSNWPVKGDGIVACDAEDGDGLARLFDEHQFRSVLNTAGNCALKSCELDPALAWRTNLAAVRTLLRACANHGRAVRSSVDRSRVFLAKGRAGTWNRTLPIR